MMGTDKQLFYIIAVDITMMYKKLDTRIFHFNISYFKSAFRP